MSRNNININFFEPQVMAILNVTPDSFYSDSRTFTPLEIEARVAQIVAQGASIIDVGGYSSRPDAVDITPDEEWERVDRALEVVRRIAPQMVVSLDTFRSEVAERAVEKYGKVIINDISAGELDPRIIEVAAKHKLPYIAMHMRGTPQNMQQQVSYNDVAAEVLSFFSAKLQQLKEAGIEQIIIDPGFGFAKTLEQNYLLLSKLPYLCKLGYPVLVGVSRKSMIYKLLGITAQEALTGTIALNWEALRNGATILRVHDVHEAVDCVTIYKKLLSV